YTFGQGTKLEIKRK
nr:Ig kappa chain J segment (J-kappa-2) - human [Homo sapiens]